MAAYGAYRNSKGSRSRRAASVEAAHKERMRRAKMRRELEAVDKADSRDVRDARTFGAVTSAVGLSPAAGIHGAMRAKDGRKLEVGLRQGGRATAESIGASMVPAGLALGGAALYARRQNRLARAGMASPNAVRNIARIGSAGKLAAFAGGVAGGMHGSGAAIRNAEKRGDLKKLPKGER
jgi:hypothetical protein